MGSRRRARELTLQALFFMDMRENFSKTALELFCRNFKVPGKSLAMFERLTTGVMRTRDQLDAVIERFSDNWKIDRMTGIDRNAMRIAAFELLCCQDIPPKVSINEAIDIGKKYGTEESGGFINGILDSIHLAMRTEPFAIDLESAPPIAAVIASQQPDSEPEPVPEPEVVYSRVLGNPNVMRKRRLKKPPAIPGSSESSKTEGAKNQD